MLFDKKMQIPIDIPHPDGAKECVVRWPNDEEWINRSRNLRVIRHQTPDGITTTSQNEVEVDRDLFNAICSQGAEGITDAEACEVIERLERMQAIDIQREGNEYIVELHVPTGKTKHRVRVPTAEERLEFQRGASSSKELGRGKTLLSFNAKPGGVLYDKIIADIEGYAAQTADAVPVIHKTAVIRLLLDALEEMVQDGTKRFF